MGKITQAQRRKGYYKIYEQIYENPFIFIIDEYSHALLLDQFYCILEHEPIW